jgi:hypothetical protein
VARKRRAIPDGSQWWPQPDELVAQVLWSQLEAVGSRLRARKDRIMRSFRAYGDVSHLSGSPMSDGAQLERVKRLTVNVTKSCVNTLHAEVIATRPRPMFLTSGGDYEQQKRAKALTKWCEGLFYESKVDTEVGPPCARDGLVFDLMVAKIVTEHGRVRAERWAP